MLSVEKSEFETQLAALEPEAKQAELDKVFGSAEVKKAAELVAAKLAEIAVEALEYAAENPAAGKAVYAAVIKLREKLAETGVSLPNPKIIVG